MIVSRNNQWIPPLDTSYSGDNFYEDTIFRQYWISTYYSVLMLTGNDIVPIGDV